MMSWIPIVIVSIVAIVTTRRRMKVKEVKQ